MDYATYLRSERWSRTRIARLRLAETNGYGYWKCEVCGRWNHQKRIEVHHKTYERIGRERMDDLIVMCHDCHADAHGLPHSGSIAELMRTLLAIHGLDVSKGNSAFD